MAGVRVSLFHPQTKTNSEDKFRRQIPKTNSEDASPKDDELEKTHWRRIPKTHSAKTTSTPKANYNPKTNSEDTFPEDELYLLKRKSPQTTIPVEHAGDADFNLRKRDHSQPLAATWAILSSRLEPLALILGKSIWPENSWNLPTPTADHGKNLEILRRHSVENSSYLSVPWRQVASIGCSEQVAPSGCNWLQVAARSRNEKEGT